MPIIAKPRSLLLYLVDKLESQGSKPTSADLVGFCSELQKAGCHIYSFSDNPQDPFLQGDVAKDILDCEVRNWLEPGKKYLSVSERGKTHLRGLRPPAEIEIKIEALLPNYKPAA